MWQFVGLPRLLGCASELLDVGELDELDKLDKPDKPDKSDKSGDLKGGWAFLVPAP